MAALLANSVRHPSELDEFFWVMTQVASLPSGIGRIPHCCMARAPNKISMGTPFSSLPISSILQQYFSRQLSGVRSAVRLESTRSQVDVYVVDHVERRC